MTQPQTFWNSFINEESFAKTFVGWVGTYDAKSKQYLYNYLLNHEPKYTTIADLGCATGTLKQGLSHYNVSIDYTGIDSCTFFVQKCISSGVHAIEADIRQVPLEQCSFDVVFGRHIVEHQDNFVELMSEMIRLARNEVIIVFFIKPDTLSDTTKVVYEASTNLYHNVYSKKLIDEFLTNHADVESWKYVDICDVEQVLHINVIHR